MEYKVVDDDAMYEEFDEEAMWNTYFADGVTLSENEKKIVEEIGENWLLSSCYRLNSRHLELIDKKCYVAS